VFHASRLFPPLRPCRTEVTEYGGKGDVINVDLIRAFGYKLVYFDASHSYWIIMLLLAGYLTGKASGTVFIFNK
jgi:hypothetical protein